MCNTNNQIKLKTSMLKSILCDYGDAYILSSGAIIVKTQEHQQLQIIEKT